MKSGARKIVGRVKIDKNLMFEKYMKWDEVKGGPSWKLVWKVKISKDWCLKSMWNKSNLLNYKLRILGTK